MENWRSSQRMPLRCTECARRRVRCDKKAPCSQCITRDRAHLCTREVVRIRGKLAVAAPVELDSGDLITENSKLRDRVSELELTLMLSLQDQVGIQSSRGAKKQQGLSIDQHVKTHDRMGAILDDWNLGVVNREPVSDLRSSHNTDRSADVLQHLPNDVISAQILQFSLGTLGWIHCAVRADQFMEEHLAFQESLARGEITILENHGWMAIYFSLLTVGLFFMSSEETAKLCLDINDSSDIQKVCEKWYNCAFRQLELANFMTKPHLYTVQVAAILTLCNSHFGEIFREENLAIMAINTARALNMHQLGTESCFPKDSIEFIPEWNTREDRELGRRLWWTITICDWLGTLLRRPPTIHPDKFDTDITIGYFDNDIILDGPSITDGNTLFSPLLHHIALSKVSRQVYDYTQSPKKSSALLSRFLEQLREQEEVFMSQMDALIYSFSDGINKSHPVPLWVRGQKAHFLCTLNFIRLTLSRILLQPLLPKLPIISQIRSHANEAAMNVVHMSDVPQAYRMMWVFGSAAIAAGVFLCLELLLSNSDYDMQHRLESRQWTKICIDILLPYAHKTRICREGPRALQWLLDLEDARQDRGASGEEIMHAILSMRRTAGNATSLQTETEVLPFAMHMERNLSEMEQPHNEAVWSDVSPTTIFGYDESEFDWLLNFITFPTVS